jgi:uncharacterized coiled-coil protein SlyX
MRWIKERIAMSGDDKKMPEIEIEGLKSRVDNMERRFDKVDTSLDKMWEKIDEQKTGQIITHTLVEGLSKALTESRIDNAKVFEKLGDKLDGLKTDMAKSDIQRLQSENTNNEKHHGKWEKFYSKAAWAIGGLIIAIVLAKLGFIGK